MNRARQVPQVATGRSAIGLYNPSPSEANVARWKINGYGAFIIIWTAAEWEGLSDRPTDAQYYPSGVWCALRME
ncbi:MAG: hypothetical protein LC745_11340 [Planctomycetia bacterium]|nr:hypothetical protein [Planctomycetia bacterium]